MAMHGWVIILWGRWSFLAREKPDGSYHPVYDLQSGIAPVRNQKTGEVGLTRQVAAGPVLGFPSFSEFSKTPDGAIVFRCDDMSRGEQEDIRGAIDMAEKIVNSARASDSGVALVGGSLADVQKRGLIPKPPGDGQ